MCVWVTITSETQLHLSFLCFKPFISDVLNFKCLCCTWHLHLGRIVHSKNSCNQLMWDVTMSSQTIFTVFFGYCWLIPWSKVLGPQMGTMIPECQASPGFDWAKPTHQGDLPLFPVGLATIAGTPLTFGDVSGGSFPSEKHINCWSIFPQEISSGRFFFFRISPWKNRIWEPWSHIPAPRQTMKKMAMLQTAETKVGGLGAMAKNCWAS